MAAAATIMGAVAIELDHDDEHDGVATAATSFCCLLLGLLAITILPCGVSGQVGPVLINCGGSGFRDQDGNQWRSDGGIAKSAVKSYSTDRSIQSSNKDQLYQSELYDAGNPKTEFGIALPNGLYRVSLHFPKIYPGNQWDGARVFDILLQDIVMYRDLDIYKKAGGYMALKINFTSSVMNGVMRIALRKRKQNPKISGIEIRSVVNKPANRILYIAHQLWWTGIP